MINTRPKYFTEKDRLPPDGIYFLKVAKEGNLFSLKVINAFRAEMGVILQQMVWYMPMM